MIVKLTCKIRKVCELKKNAHTRTYTHTLLYNKIYNVIGQLLNNIEIKTNKIKCECSKDE